MITIHTCVAFPLFKNYTLLVQHNDRDWKVVRIKHFQWNMQDYLFHFIHAALGFTQEGDNIPLTCINDLWIAASRTVSAKQFMINGEGHIYTHATE